MTLLNSFNSPVYHLEIIDSTNKFAKDLTIGAVKNGTIIIADEQTNGRGRFGNNWCSIKNKGIYYSIIFEKSSENLKYETLTLFISLAISRLIEHFSINPKIKWPNDILISGKKVCGILSESISNNNRDFIIIGIGINLYHNSFDFENDIKDKATSISLNTSKQIDREGFINLLTEYIHIYYNYFLSYTFSNFLKEYEDKSYILNKFIKINLNNEILSGKVIGFNERGFLILKTSDKTIEISSGEVSLSSIYKS